MKKSEKHFPTEIPPDKKMIDLAEDGVRTVDDISEKEKKLFIRIYPFTPDNDLCKKFGLDYAEVRRLVKVIATEGTHLKKDESYSRSIVKADPKKPVLATTETPAHLLSAFMNSVNEEERRELVNMYEEGMDPIELMKQVIVVQSSRAIRGTKLEKGSTTLQKQVNDAFSDLATMIGKLHEMEEGQKVIHGFDDSFVGLILASQQRQKQNDNDVIDI
jgi:hypothetical protein